MPIYEYACTACGHTLEKLQKMSDAPLKDCPDCGEACLEKQISAAGFRLSGGGWYETDFKSNNQKNLTSKGADSKGKKATSESASKGADSKGKKATSESASKGKAGSKSSAS